MYDDWIPARPPNLAPGGLGGRFELELLEAAPHFGSSSSPPFAVRTLMRIFTGPEYK